MDIVLAVNCRRRPRAGAGDASRRGPLGPDAAGGMRSDDLEDVLDGHVAPIEPPGAIEPL